MVRSGQEGTGWVRGESVRRRADCPAKQQRRQRSRRHPAATTRLQPGLPSLALPCPAPALTGLHHAISALHAALRGQAVHEAGMRPRRLHQVLRHLARGVGRDRMGRSGRRPRLQQQQLRLRLQQGPAGPWLPRGPASGRPPGSPGSAGAGSRPRPSAPCWPTRLRGAGGVGGHAGAARKGGDEVGGAARGGGGGGGGTTPAGRASRSLPVQAVSLGQQPLPPACQAPAPATTTSPTPSTHPCTPRPRP